MTLKYIYFILAFVGGWGPMDRLLDESLITSDVCIQCGSCCKVSSDMQFANDKGKEWINVIWDREGVEIKWHNKTKTKVTGALGDSHIEESHPYKIVSHCPKLIVDEEAGTKVCGIYEKRPDVCRDYNCFRDANNRRRRPQNWDLIAGLIKKVHNVDVEWPLPLQKSNWTENSIKVKEI